MRRFKIYYKWLKVSNAPHAWQDDYAFYSANSKDEARQKFIIDNCLALDTEFEIELIKEV